MTRPKVKYPKMGSKKREIIQHGKHGYLELMENGFTFWGNNHCWIIDASCIHEHGMFNVSHPQRCKRTHGDWSNGKTFIVNKQARG